MRRLRPTQVRSSSPSARSSSRLARGSSAEQPSGTSPAAARSMACRETRWTAATSAPDPSGRAQPHRPADRRGHRPRVGVRVAGRLHPGQGRARACPHTSPLAASTTVHARSPSGPAGAQQHPLVGGAPQRLHRVDPDARHPARRRRHGSTLGRVSRIARPPPRRRSRRSWASVTTSPRSATALHGRGVGGPDGRGLGDLEAVAARLGSGQGDRRLAGARRGDGLDVGPGGGAGRLVEQPDRRLRPRDVPVGPARPLGRVTAQDSLLPVRVTWWSASRRT